MIYHRHTISHHDFISNHFQLRLVLQCANQGREVAKSLNVVCRRMLTKGLIFADAEEIDSFELGHIGTMM